MHTIADFYRVCYDIGQEHEGLWSVNRRALSMMRFLIDDASERDSNWALGADTCYQAAILLRTGLSEDYTSNRDSLGYRLFAPLLEAEYGNKKLGLAEIRNYIDQIQSELSAVLSNPNVRSDFKPVGRYAELRPC